MAVISEAQVFEGRLNMKKYLLGLLFVVFLTSITVAQDPLVEHLQNISVQVIAEKASGSGIVFHRDVLTKDNRTKRVYFVWTNAHVLESCRHVIEQENGEKTIHFNYPRIKKCIHENGIIVGCKYYKTKVLLYSNDITGHDLALLMILDQDFKCEESVEFDYKNIPKAGQRIWHIGSFLGDAGSNSFSEGFISQIGRVLMNTPFIGTFFDQVSCTAFPGSSGGGVFLAEGDSKGKCIGLLSRQRAETFNYIIPARRIYIFCKENNLMWAIDKSVSVPFLDSLNRILLDE